jgi:hypothetical protein
LSARRPVWRRLLPRLTRRTVLLALLLGIALTTWARTEVAGRYTPEFTIIPLEPTSQASGDFAVQGLWQLQALSESFGGYSALFVQGGIVRLFSDKGWLLTFARPDRPDRPPEWPHLRQLYPTSRPLVDLLDIESATFDRTDGRFWVGYENHDTIYRYSVAGEPEQFVEPAYTAHWGDNSGIEAMVRLADGRFVVLKETGGLGYLYPGDPVEGGEPLEFRIAWPDGYDPVDMTELPDGRVLILLRRLTWRIPVFESRLVLADPALIDAEQPWPVRPLLQLESLLPRDNYEGVAVEPAADGSLTLWLVSDDNRSALQRSLLAKLRWVPDSSQADSRATESVAPESAGQ